MTGLLPLLTLAVLSGAAASTHASTPASDPATGPATAVAATDALLRDYRGQVPGASVLVLRDGQPLYRRGHGLAESLLPKVAPIDAAVNLPPAAAAGQAEGGGARDEK